MKRRKVKVPEHLKFTYGEYIRKCVKLENDWLLITVVNGTAIFYKENCPEFCVAKFKKVIVAKNGLFMIILKTGDRIIYDADGMQLSVGGYDCMLFPNGWYRIQYSNKMITLFNAEGFCVANKLRTAEVYPDGKYYISVVYDAWDKGDCIPGLYNADGTRIYLSNAKKITVLKNGWFIADGCLYDNFGDLSIGTANGRYAYPWLLKLYGFFRKRKV